MNAQTWLALLSIIPTIITTWNSSSGNTLSKVSTLLTGNLGQAALADLEALGAEWFPNLTKDFQAAGAALTLALQHFGVIYWIQDGLNFAIQIGEIPGPALTADGTWGPKTQAALTALQTKLGISPTGVFADAENLVISVLTGQSSITSTISAALSALIAKL